MNSTSSIIAIIPARGGSKGVPKKNIKRLGGYPLIAYSIIAARLCPEISRAIVSTDSLEIAELAKSYGAEVPFLRPAELAQDTSTNLEFIQHALEWFQKEEGSEPELLIQLLPTTPLREVQLLSTSIQLIQSHPEATSLRAVHQLPEPPQKMMRIEDGFLTGFFPDDPRPEYYNLPRQTFPPAYQPNGVVEIIRSNFVKKGTGLFGTKALALITPFTVEVDHTEQFQYLEYFIDQQGHPLYEYLKTHFQPL